MVDVAVNWYHELFSMDPQKTELTFPGWSDENVTSVDAENDPGPCVNVAGVGQKSLVPAVGPDTPQGCACATQTEKVPGPPQ